MNKFFLTLFLIFILPSENAKANDVLKDACLVAKTFIAENPSTDLDWSWGEGVALWGLAALTKKVDHKEGYESCYQLTSEYLLNYHKHWNNSRRKPKINYPDRVPPSISAVLELQRTGNRDFLPSILLAYDFLKNTPRMKNGAINHLGTHFFSHFYPESIWADSLVMYVVPSILIGKYYSNSELLKFAHNQYGIFIQNLQNPHNYLFYHAWNVRKERMIPKKDPSHWLRGNGWAAASMAMALSEMKTENNHNLQDRFEVLLASLYHYQMENGLWDTILDDPGYSYQETSGSALIAFATFKAMNSRSINSIYKTKALKTYDTLVKSLTKHRSGGLTLPGTSWHTNPSKKSKYARISQKDNVSYGVGAFLLLSTEVSKDGYYELGL